MTKPLDREIKALRAIDRALQPLTAEERQRDLEWLVAREAGLPWIKLPQFVFVSAQEEGV